MVELQDRDIWLTAIDAWIIQEISLDLFPYPVSILFVPY
jgi:hypothetical protein